MIGRVKWFKGPYGFLEGNQATGGRDVMVHHSIIDREGYRTLLCGELVSFEMEETPAGLRATCAVPVPLGVGEGLVSR